MKPHALRLANVVTAALLLSASAAPAAGQDDVMRDIYRFLGSTLDVDVATEAAGRIRLIRGRSGFVEVAGRTPDGFTTAALGGWGVRRLTLTALGSERADFIVTVPENVRVRVHWDGSDRTELFGSLSETATYSWSGPDPRPAFETLRSSSRGTAAAGATPRFLDVVDAYRLQRLTVSIGDDGFALSPAAALETRRSGDRLELLSPRDGDVRVRVPRGERMTLELDGTPAVVIDGDDVRVLCDAVLSQVLPDGTHWLTLTPGPDGGDCSAPAPTPSRRATPASARRT